MATRHDQSATTPLSTRTVFATATMRAGKQALRRHRLSPEAGGRRDRSREAARIRFAVALTLIAAGIGWLILVG